MVCVTMSSDSVTKSENSRCIEMRIQEIIDPLHLLFARLAFSAIDDVKTRTQHGFG